MATSDELNLQAEAQVEAKKKAPAEKPPAETDIAIEQGNFNVIDERMLAARNGGVVEVKEFGQTVDPKQELGSLAQDESVLTDREIGDRLEQARTEIKQVQIEATPQVAETPKPADTIPPEIAANPELLKMYELMQQAKDDQERIKQQMEADHKQQREKLEAEKAAAAEQVKAEKPAETAAPAAEAASQAAEAPKPAEAVAASAEAVPQAAEAPSPAVAEVNTEILVAGLAVAESAAQPVAEAAPQAAEAPASAEQPAAAPEAKEADAQEQLKAIHEAIRNSLPALREAAAKGDLDAVKRGYRRLIRDYHEDKFAQSALRPAMSELNKRINAIDGALKATVADEAQRAKLINKALDGLEQFLAVPAVQEAAKPTAAAEATPAAGPALDAGPAPAEAPRMEEVPVAGALPESSAAVETESKENLAETIRECRGQTGSIARELWKNEGYLTDSMPDDFKKLKEQLEKLPKDGLGVENLKEVIDHLGMILDPVASPDAAQKMKALKQFFAENPDLAPTDEAEESGEEVEYVLKRLGIPERPKLPEAGDFGGLIDIEGTAFAIDKGDFADFFDKDNGSRYKSALEDAAAGNALRDKLIQELVRSQPKDEAERSLINGKINLLKEANRLVDLRKKQWDMQKTLHEGMKVNGLHETSIAETQADLDEVSRMLEDNPNDPNLAKRKASLEMQLESQSNEYQNALAWQNKQTEDIDKLGLEINAGIAGLKLGAENLAKAAKAKEQEKNLGPDVGEYGVAGHGQELVEDKLASGAKTAADIAGEGISKGVSTLVDLMHGGSDTDMIGALHEAAQAPGKAAEFIIEKVKTGKSAGGRPTKKAA